MARKKKTSREPSHAKSIEKVPSGIRGLDEITVGGLPRGRPTLVADGAGAGKTLFAMEFLVRGNTEYNEPGVFIAFEETAEELTKNVASLGFDVNDPIRKNKLRIDYVYIERSKIQETGEYDLEGLFICLGAAIDAKRVVLDNLEALFFGFQNETILRAELRRLFRWLKDRGITAEVTGEQNAMDHLWKEVKRNVSANRHFAIIDDHAQAAENWIRGLTSQQALRKAGILSRNFWLGT